MVGGSQGYANVSHGCTGMSTANAAWLYGVGEPGDVVDYTGAFPADRPSTTATATGTSPSRQSKQGSALAGPSARPDRPPPGSFDILRPDRVGRVRSALPGAITVVGDGAPSSSTRQSGPRRHRARLDPAADGP